MAAPGRKGRRSAGRVGAGRPEGTAKVAKSTVGTQPWEQQPGESFQAYAAFSEYRDMGVVRQIRGVAKALGKSEALMYRWSTRHTWVRRAELYDRDEERSHQLTSHLARRRMAERHANISNLFLAKVVDQLKELDPSRLSPRDLIQWLDVASKVERIARGDADPAMSRGQDATSEIGALTDEERHERLARIRAEIDRRLGEAPPGASSVRDDGADDDEYAGASS